MGNGGGSSVSKKILSKSFIVKLSQGLEGLREGENVVGKTELFLELSPWNRKGPEPEYGPGGMNC